MALITKITKERDAKLTHSISNTEHIDILLRQFKTTTEEMIKTRSIRDFTDAELIEQISYMSEQLDILQFGSADYYAAKAELVVARRELERRETNNI